MESASFSVKCYGNMKVRQRKARMAAERLQLSTTFRDEFERSSPHIVILFLSLSLSLFLSNSCSVLCASLQTRKGFRALIARRR